MDQDQSPPAPPVQVPVIEGSNAGSGGQDQATGSNDNDDDINDALDLLETFAKRKKNIFDKDRVPVLSPQCIQPESTGDHDHDGSETDLLPESQLVFPAVSAPVSPVAVKRERDDDDDDKSRQIDIILRCSLFDLNIC